MKTLRSFMALLCVCMLVASYVNPFTGLAAKTEKVEYEIASWFDLISFLEDEESDVTAATYKLTDDIVWEEGFSAIEIPSGHDITLDTNGHIINRGQKSMIDDGYVIKVDDGATLTITDSTETPGKIMGGANSGNGGAVMCEDGAKLTISGGVRICGNKAKYGGGVYLGDDSELTLSDVTIDENDATIEGGGIYASKSVISFLGGLTKIKNNTKNNNDNDLYMSAETEKLRFYTIEVKKNKTQTKVYGGRFLKGSRIGLVFEKLTNEISEGYGQANNYEASVYFYCDDDEYEVDDNKKLSEINLIRNRQKEKHSADTVLEIYKDGKLDSRDKYESFIKAFDAGKSASGERHIVMGSDYSSDTEIVVNKGYDLTIDLNGHYIKRNRDHETKKNGGVIKLQKSATLTIEDSNPDIKGFDGVSGGVITGGASSNYGGGITLLEDAHLVMKGGTIYDCVSDEDGGGIYIDTGSVDTSFVMLGGSITNCRALESTDNCYGGAIYLGDGKLDLKNGTIDGNYSEDHGGGIYCNRGNVYLENMIFSGNTAYERGGAIYISLDIGKYRGTTFYARGCKFSNNEAREDGGAFFLRDNPEHSGAVMFDRCEFKKNKAKEDGGAICVFDDGAVLSNVTITGNKAGKYGGGVFVDSRYDISLKGVMVIRDNSCDKKSSCADLCLEDGSTTTARVVSGGLSKGSWIGIGSTSSKSIRLSKKMPRYEMKYFHPLKGTLDLRKTKDIEMKMVVTSSIIGNGRIWIIVLIGIISVIAAITVVMMSKNDQIRTGQGGDL